MQNGNLVPLTGDSGSGRDGDLLVQGRGSTSEASPTPRVQRFAVELAPASAQEGAVFGEGESAPFVTVDISYSKQTVLEQIAVVRTLSLTLLSRVYLRQGPLLPVAHKVCKGNHSSLKHLYAPSVVQKCNRWEPASGGAPTSIMSES